MTIADWLRNLGLGQYSAAFEENAVDLDVLPRLTGDDLRDIGVAAVGHRRLLLDAISRLRDETGEPADATDRGTAGERRQVSVLFADLVGYTELSAALDAEEVQALLESYFSLADRAVIDHGGSVDKHIGDCVMAVFGAPVAHDNDPERAVRAAIAIRDGACGLVTGIGRDIAVHVGVASGEVVAAASGQEHRQYTVTGEAVNLASRLAGRARPGEILISSATHSAVSRLFECDMTDRFELKGFAEPLVAWRVHRASRGEPQSLRPLVGRAAELRQFSAALDGCSTTAMGQTIYIRGEPGIGKSRLVEEFRRRAVEAGYAAHQGLVLDFGGDNGRAAIAALTRSLIGLAPDAGIEAAAAALDETVPGTAAEVADRAAAFDLLNMPLPGEELSVFAAMDNATRLHHARRMLVRLVDAASRRTPVLVIVEDVHWADGVTLDLVAGIADMVTERAVLLVVTTRREGDPTAYRWTPTGPMLTLDLAPLGRDDAMAMAAGYFDAAATTVEACVERAAGNPLFLDQLLQHARARAEDAVPDTVQSLVQARMDQLPVRDRRALQTAAVLGQTFSLEALRHLLDDADFECGRLVQRHLLRRYDDGLMFTHALIRDAAYATLLRQMRRDLHRRAAKWLDGEDRALAAEHLAMAEDAAAPRACLDAAAALVGRYRYEQALALIDRGLGLACEPDERVSLLLGRGEAALLSGDAQAAQEAYADALDSASEPRCRCRALLGLASARRITDDIDQAMADVDQAIELAEREGMIDEWSRGLALRGNLLFPRGDIEGCCDAHERSLELARQAGSAELEAAALGGLGDGEYMRGRLGTAFARYSECVEMSARNGLRRTEAAYLPMKAITNFWNGDIRATRTLGLAAIEAATQIGHERASMIAHHAAYFGCRYLELYDEAMQHARRSLAIARALKAPRFEAEGLTFVAQLAADAGDLQAARDGFREALSIGRSGGMAYLGPILLCGCAQIARTGRERAEAVEEAEQLLACGSASHNHLVFRQELIDLCLRRRDWPGVRHHTDALEAYAQVEPSSLVRLIVDRARALSMHAQGCGEVRDELERIAREARRIGDLHALRAIEAALSSN